MDITDILPKITRQLVDKVKPLKDMSIQTFVDYVKQTQLEMMQQFGLASVSIRPLDLNRLQDLFTMVQTGEGGQLYFRHGEQDPGSVVAALDDKRKKIIMMQEEHNTKDPITLSSAIEFIGTLMMIAFLKENLDYQASVSSSLNLRAFLPADQLATVLAVSNDATLPEWACINYPPDGVLDESQLDAKGNLKWERGKVDAVVGVGTFDRITTTMQAELGKPSKAKSLEVTVTHTQQLDVIYQELFGSPSAGPLSNYGFIIRNNLGKHHRFEHGVYSTQKVTLERAPSVGKLAGVSGMFDSSTLSQEGDQPVQSNLTNG